MPARSIYIPLCFYFICLRYHKIPLWLSDLHSTMLLLYQRSFRKSAELLLYLHSTMLLLYPWGWDYEINEVLHLHSTMLLLYGMQAISPASGSGIYIPLCFYFIFIRSDRLRSRFHLHSTMLLLYPAPERTAVIAGYLFTFHYASTLSDIRAGNKPAGKYIYIPLCFYFIQE